MIATTRALNATYQVALWLIPLSFYQIIIAIIGLPGLAAGAYIDSSILAWIPLISDFLIDSGLALFQATHFFAFILATLALIGASLHYILLNVWDCFSGIRLVIFAIVFGLSAFFPIIPWIFIWIIAVVYLAE